MTSDSLEFVCPLWLTPRQFAAYDVTRRETFESISEIWMKEVEMYATVEGAVKAVIGNKVDQVWFSSSLGIVTLSNHESNAVRSLDVCCN